ncbi:hypothetical protein EDD11_006649 [Mortierella claussenii]|nr:hypothetical protein EDD11_006649 [Mortierella claussenii]
MKPQLGQSKLAILKHAPSVHRKRRPIELRRKQSDLSSSVISVAGSGPGFGSNNSGSGSGRLHNMAILRRTVTPGGLHAHGHAHGHGQGHPPSLLRRQTTRQKSFMELDTLPSIRALRREPSMMELDPPLTLFAPVPQPSQFMPGPWAFFQAAEAQREQKQAQIEFLTRLQELRVRDEQLFVRLMGGFARECPIQFAQLTGFMKHMEMEMEQGANGDGTSFFGQQQLFQQHSQRREDGFLGKTSANNLWEQQSGTKMGLLALAQAFGNQVDARSSHRDQFQRQQRLQQQQQQQFQGRGRHHGKGGRGNGRFANNNNHRGGAAHNNNNNNNNNNHSSRAPAVPSLRRGKTFQQQQHAMQQLTAYQRHLYQQVQQMHQQKQHGWHGSSSSPSPPLDPRSPGSIPMAHELMQYAAMLANDGSTNAIPPLLSSNLSSPSSSLNSSNSASPISPGGFGSLMAQMQQHEQQYQQYQQQQGFYGTQRNMQQQQQQYQQQQQQDPLELAAMNMQMNMGSSRRSRYKPPPLRSH